MDQNVEYNDELQTMAAPICLSARVHKCSGANSMVWLWGIKKRSQHSTKLENTNIKSKGGR
jgi:hypothetical protein